jgi:phospholipase D1/2
MRPAPVPNEDETHLEDEARVADPLSDEFLNLLDTTAKVNREVFWELFRPIPSNLVRKWKDYDVYKSKAQVGHVVPGVPLRRVKERLALVRGSIVEAQLDFLIDEKEIVEGLKWNKLNPTLQIYI